MFNDVRARNPTASFECDFCLVLPRTTALQKNVGVRGIMEEPKGLNKCWASWPGIGVSNNDVAQSHPKKMGDVRSGGEKHSRFLTSPVRSQPVDDSIRSIWVFFFP